MKKFILRLLYFLLPIIVGWMGIEAMYRFVPNNYSVKYEGLRKNKDAEVFILGNSHSFYGLYPELMSIKTYNASNISQPLICDKLLFEKYIANNTNAKAIVLTIDNFSFSEGIDDVELSWRRYFYRDCMYIDVPGTSHADPKGYSLALAPRFNITMESIKLYFKTGTLVQCNDRGAGRNEGVSPEFNNEKIAKIIVGKHLSADGEMAPNINILEEIITTAADKNIKVLIITMPVTSYYSRFSDKNKMKKVSTICTQMEQKHPNVTYLNLFTDSRFNNNDFYDTDHLNESGAHKCTTITDSTLNEILKRK
ncbi:hypothetical protein ACLI09_03985 [Flavobacterium sp. RHBU_24]|uniref:hypothetical protein n=1 Tax=Flavobacterium sp. RHBU_24 TaxID=3391185 RepID=UPI0039854515